MLFDNISTNGIEIQEVKITISSIKTDFHFFVLHHRNTDRNHQTSVNTRVNWSFNFRFQVWTVLAIVNNVSWGLLENWQALQFLFSQRSSPKSGLAWYLVLNICHHPFYSRTSWLQENNQPNNKKNLPPTIPQCKNMVLPRNPMKCAVLVKINYILFQIYIFPPVVLEHLLTVEEKTSIPLAKITEDSKHALSWCRLKIKRLIRCSSSGVQDMGNSGSDLCSSINLSCWNSLSAYLVG